MKDKQKSKLILKCLKLEGKKQGIKKITQKELANALDLPPTRISDFLLFKRPINIKLLITIKNRYNITWAAIGKLLEQDYC